MWSYDLRPFNLYETITTISFIAGGSILLISFATFLFLKTEDEL
ncbi:hypothetical protein [Virgibacillus pantothenticus]|nr:hypothetical protein [Virgibacillus pantothenticus]